MEVNVIWEVCKIVGSWNLEGVVMYSSCECCFMCYVISYWVRIDKIYYVVGWSDFEDFFDDSNISKDLEKFYFERLLVLE